MHVRFTNSRLNILKQTVNHSLSSKELHAKQGEDEDEEEEEEQKTEDGAHTAQQWDDQVTQVGPVPGKTKQKT